MSAFALKAKHPLQIFPPPELYTIQGGTSPISLSLEN
jgi:hypothetical protein